MCHSSESSLLFLFLCEQTYFQRQTYFFSEQTYFFSDHLDHFLIWGPSLISGFLYSLQKQKTKREREKKKKKKREKEKGHRLVLLHSL